MIVGMVAKAPVDAESLAELRRWLRAVDALAEAVNSTRSLPAILDLVAGSARELLALDFCAVLLPDADRRNLVITGWSGLSAEYVARVNADRPVRLTADDGELAPSSRAFTTARPVAIADIALQPDFTPWGGVAREQGYRAMVSVPLIAGGTVVGTLNGYHAVVHDFTEQEFERLTLLANHAAIALTSARLVEKMQSLNDSLRRQRDLLTKSEQIHQQLLAVALAGGGLGGIVEVLSSLVGRPVLIEDERGSILAQTGAPAELLELEFRRLAGVEPGSSGPQAVQDRHGGWYLVWTVQLDDELVARVWLTGARSELSPIDSRAVEHASIVMSLELVRLRTAIEVEHRLRGELLADVLGGVAIDSVSVRERAARLGHDLSAAHVAIVGLVVAADPARQHVAYRRALTAVAEVGAGMRPRPLVAMHRGQIVGLWPVGPAAGHVPASDGAPPPPDERTVTRAAADGVRRAMASIPGVAVATVAVSGSGSTTHRQAYRTARGALDVAVRSGRVNTTVTVQDLGVSGLLLQLDDPDQLLEFANRTLSGVLRHDRRRGTQLLETLRSYLDHHLGRLETAGSLHVHPNTVTQRLQRIEALTGLDLSDPSAIVQVRAAMLLLDVAQGNRTG